MQAAWVLIGKSAHALSDRRNVAALERHPQRRTLRGTPLPNRRGVNPSLGPRANEETAKKNNFVLFDASVFSVLRFEIRYLRTLLAASFLRGLAKSGALEERLFAQRADLLATSPAMYSVHDFVGPAQRGGELDVSGLWLRQRREPGVISRTCCGTRGVNGEGVDTRQQPTHNFRCWRRAVTPVGAFHNHTAPPLLERRRLPHHFGQCEGHGRACGGLVPAIQEIHETDAHRGGWVSLRLGRRITVVGQNHRGCAGATDAGCRLDLKRNAHRAAARRRV